MPASSRITAFGGRTWLTVTRKKPASGWTKEMNLDFINTYRIRGGKFASSNEDGLNGAFLFSKPGEARRIFCIVSDELDWKHVSVSFGPNKSVPSWEVMCWVKEIFFEPEETAMQLHPPRSQWISNHPGCLHLWAPLKEKIPLPPSIMVGIQALGEIK